MSSIERVTVKLPTGFNPAKHQRALMKLITDKYGEGFELDSIDPAAGTASVSRQVAITEVTQSTDDSFEVRLARGTKPADGEKVEAKLMDSNPGYYMSRFEPFLGKATLTRLTDDEARCRGAVAVALGVKPWDVGVSARSDGGFDLRLPKTYVGSKHDTKLDEVATDVVGRDGWYVKVNAQQLTASLIPADPPTFPKAISFPMEKLGKGDAMSTPFGWQLPGPGETTSPVAAIDWRASGSALVSGLAGGGKAQPLDTPIPVPVSEKFPTGWAVMGDLAVGDLVWSRDEHPVAVTSLSEIHTGEVYEVSLRDGRTVEADAAHLWVIDSPGDLDVTDEIWAFDSGLAELSYDHVGDAAQVSLIAALSGWTFTAVRDRLDEAGAPYETIDGARWYALDEALALMARPGRRIVTTLGLLAGDRLPPVDGQESVISSVTRVGMKQVRCISVDHPEHIYLTGDKIPTHNTVTITAILADRIANGAHLVVLDTADKSIDYLAFKDMCGVEGVDGNFIPGWGCDTLGDTVAVLAMLCEEGKRRAKMLARLGINNWLDLPPDKAFKPIFIIADEYEALVTRVPEPKALPKDHPIRVEAIEENMAHDLISHYTNRIVKEFRFVGLNPLISTQVSNASTGLPPSLKGKMGHFVLCGSTPSEAARKQSFPDASGVPTVPENVASGGAVARGTGSAKIEGGGAFVFKSYFAPVNDYREALLKAGVPTYDVRKVVPTQAQIDEFLPSLDSEDADVSPAAPSGGDRGPSGRSAAEIARSMGDDTGVAIATGALGTGYEKANAMRNLAAGGGQTRKQKAEAAEEAEWAKQSGEVQVNQRQPEGDDW